MTATARRPNALVRFALRLSTLVLRCERVVLMTLMGWVLLLILLNVTTRYLRMPIYWIDEAAVFSVVWLCFVGASSMTRLRLDFSVTLLADRFGERGARVLKVLSTLGVFIFGCSMIAMCWVWMDPVGLARFGFDVRAFAEETFNFLYTERTQTLNWPTWVVQLILPIFGVTFTTHALANLIEDLGLAPAEKLPGFQVGSADAVN